MESQETFLSHLIELRDRLIRCLVAVGIAFVPAFYFGAELYDLLARPVIASLPEGDWLIGTVVFHDVNVPD